MRQIGLVVVATLAVVLVASCSFKAQVGNPKDIGTDAGGDKAATTSPDTKAPAAETAGPKVVVLDVGDERDESTKHITHQTREFKPEAKAMYINPGVKGLAKGATVKATLEAEDVTTKSGEEIRDHEMTTVQIQAPGAESTFNLKFTPTTAKWPVGKYRVRLSTGGKEFEVIELTVK
jgi:hypothetical protein